MAERYGFDERTIVSWANKGYPLPNKRRVKLEGFMLIGRRLRCNVDIKRTAEYLGNHLERIIKENRCHRNLKERVTMEIHLTNDN